MGINPRVASPRGTPLQSALDVSKIREDFPALEQYIHGKPLVYLDNAATTHKPRAVIESTERFYTRENSNVHRGVHWLSQRATEAYEDARLKAKSFLNAGDSREIIFVRGVTEAINLVASAYGRMQVDKGDEVLISAMEHHSNIVPWQILCQEKGAILKVIPMNDAGELLLGKFEELLSPRTRLVSLVHVSNALGTVNPVEGMIQMSHKRNIPVFVDGAQAAPHMEIDVSSLDCDFYAFSGHKIYGPTGIGVLYGKAKFLELMPPYQSGGDMIRSVSFEETTYNALPYKFEAGTPNIAGGIGLATAIDYVQGVGSGRIAAYESELVAYAADQISKIDGVQLIGDAKRRAGVVSFVIDGIHAHDVGTILDQGGIAVRTGHHCAQPIMDRFGIPATVRASFSFYNTKAEVDALVEGLNKVVEVFQ